ncbi:MAG: ABC transporter ATP-binding protein [Steroidobacteraceae bacterium]
MTSFRRRQQYSEPPGWWGGWRWGPWGWPGPRGWGAPGSDEAGDALRAGRARNRRTGYPEAMGDVIEISGVSKRYASGLVALQSVDLSIRRGEIFALLGPNGAGKTTLINIVCGIVRSSSGRVLVDGYDIVRDWRKARSLIGLVPQELTTDAFESVWNTVSFTRGLFGLRAKPAHIERVLRALSLWDRKDSRIMTLSGGMKRRVLIAKALAHEPRILFLDEPTAGVDVDLRHEMWQLVSRMRTEGVTVILTTHYIEEAEEMADRIGVINQGELVLVKDKADLMREFGTKRLSLRLLRPLSRVPEALSAWRLELSGDGGELTLLYDARHGSGGVGVFLEAVRHAGIEFTDLATTESSLEDIFVTLVRQAR